MYRRFPIPIFFKDKKYVGGEVELPDGGTLANVSKVARTGDYFSALRSLLIGCIKSIKDDNGNEITDSIQLKSLISKMPTRSADTLSALIFIEYNDGDDAVEGIYPCPRCGHRVISEKTVMDGMELDTTDHLSILPINYYDGETGEFEVNLTKAVTFINTATKESLDEIIGFTMRFPNLEDGISAFQKVGSNDEIRQQFSMFVSAITSMNGDPVDNKIKAVYGDLLFEKMRGVKKDLGFITNTIKGYGMQSEVDKHCNACGKDWKAPVNTSSFFVSALSSI